MGKAISRAQFLRGDFRGERFPLRPPWSCAEADFTARCSRCGDCLSNCETGVLTKGQGGFPSVDFARGECTFCGACAAACPTGAIAHPSSRTPWPLVARIGEACLTRQGVICRTCAEQCETGAIRFRLAVGGVALPEFNPSACTGCGACYAPCPVSAITLQVNEEASS